MKNLLVAEYWSNVPATTGKISVVKRFDDTFFGIYSGVASMMDPMTRVTIERAYEAIMDAGMLTLNFFFRRHISSTLNME